MAAVIFASTSTANIFCYFLPQFTSGLLGFPLKLKALLSCSYAAAQCSSRSKKRALPLNQLDANK